MRTSHIFELLAALKAATTQYAAGQASRVRRSAAFDLESPINFDSLATKLTVKRGCLHLLFGTDQYVHFEGAFNKIRNLLAASLETPTL